MTFKLNLNNIINTFRIGLGATILSWFAIIWFILIKYHIVEMNRIIPDRMNETILLVFISTGFLWVPSVICLLQYIYYSIGIELHFDSDGRMMIIKTDEDIVNITLNEIVMIKKICSRAVAERRINLVSTDPFYYYKVYTTDGITFIIPCLIVGEELSDFFKGKTEVVPKFIAFIT